MKHISEDRLESDLGNCFRYLAEFIAFTHCPCFHQATLAAKRPDQSPLCRRPGAGGNGRCITYRPCLRCGLATLTSG